MVSESLQLCSKQPGSGFSPEAAEASPRFETISLSGTLF